MFDTNKIAKVIKEARIKKNMTQMQLADEMGVSYQAVSNWERGNSMPDISKLEDLCRVLGITVNELLGMEAPAADAVNKLMDNETLSAEELAEVAPVLPPEEVKKQAEQGRGKKKLNLSAIAELAPFLDEEYLHELVMEAASEDMEGLEELAPFLADKTLEMLAETVVPKNLLEIVDIAPFLSEKALDTLVRKCADQSDLDAISDLAPFLSEGTLDMLAAGLLDKGELEALSDLYPFLSRDSLRKIADRLMRDKNLDGLEEIVPYI